MRDWLDSQSFELMEWPPFSPDLNPIENLWSVLKAKIYELDPEIRTASDNDDTLNCLIQAAQVAWSQIDMGMLKNLAVTMPHHVEQVLANDGWYTSYQTTFLRKPRDLPFPLSARLHAAFGSLSSPDRTRSRAVRARSDQGAIREQAGAILE